MTSLNQQVEQYRKEHVLNLYLQHPDEIERDLRNENETRDDYEGREVLELLQNAVDQVETGGKIHIGLKDKVLTVANTGAPFNFAGVKSLMKSNLSSKKENNSTIGQKGLGFRSLLNWSQHISIFSDDISIEFTEGYRYELFRQAGILRPTAVLVAPEIIEPIDREDYDTVIKINIIDENKILEVKRQLECIDKYTLLFLNKITDLTVRIEDKVTLFKRESDKDIVIISENDEQYMFNTYRKKGMINERNYEIVIAYDESIIPEENKLYSYFETNIDFPIKWKCHATFELESNRNGIKKSLDNQKLLFEPADFICSKATELEEPGQYAAFDSLLKSNDFPAGLNIKGENFNDTFNQQFEKALVLPTFSEFRTSLNKTPIFYEETPFFFKYIASNNILLSSNNKLRNEIIRKYSRHFDDGTLSEIINDYVKYWDKKQRIAVFLWWENEFFNSDILPKLILNKNGDFIDSGETVYFIRGRDLTLPCWAKVNQLDYDYEEELKTQLMYNETFAAEVEEDPNHIIERVIARNSNTQKYLYKQKLITHINFRDADTSAILTPINGSIDNNYENALLYVKWLWENYSNKVKWNPPVDLTFLLPSSNGMVVRANNLYFSSKYHNSLGEKLFLNEKYHPFIEPNRIGIGEEDLLEFRKFISKLGVLRFPELEKRKITDDGFLRLFNQEFLTSKLPGNDVNERNPRIVGLSYNVIDGLKEILESLSIEEIINWINNDTGLKNELNLKHFGEITFSWDSRMQAMRTGSFDDYDFSYIKYIFQKSHWFEISGIKYMPSQCVFDYPPGMDISNVVPTITNQLVKGIADYLRITQKDLRSFLRKVGVHNFISDLDSNEFYGVLLELPNKDQSGQVSEKIYREISEMDDQGKFLSSDNYELFLANGKVFTQNHDGKHYHLVIDSFFSSSRQANIGNYHIMRTPSSLGGRAGSFEKFARIFGVNKFVEKYEVKQSSVIYHHKNNSFQINFTDFKFYARAWSERNNNIKKHIDNIKVNIVSQVVLIDNGATQQIQTDYLLIKDNNSWLIYVDEGKDFDYRQVSKCIEELFEQIANTTSSAIPNQLGELFRDREGRKFLVEKYFGTAEVINQVVRNQIRMNLAEVLNISYDLELLNNINFNSFNSIENSMYIIDLLTAYDKDVAEIMDQGFEYEINLVPWFKQEVKKYISQHEVEYKNKLFVNYKSKDDIVQKDFYKEYLKFKNYFPKDGTIENSIDVNVKRLINEKFPVLKNGIGNLSASESYDSNFNVVVEGFNKEGFGDFIDENIHLKSWIYFLNEVKARKIIDLYKEKIAVREKFTMDDDKEALPVDSDDVILTKSVFKPVHPKSKKSHHGNSTTRTFTKSYIEKENRNRDNIGRQAESLVREKLINIYPSLRWTSENSDIPEQRNNSTIYDMEYWKDDIKRFIEVKAATNRFYMSSAEYNFANDNVDNYELYLVDFESQKIDGPHGISEFELSKVATEFLFSFKNN